MAAEHLTERFPAHIKPVHVGPYRTELRSSSTGALVEIGYSYWDGANWGNSQPTPCDARRHFLKHGLGQQSKPWWGLAEKPQ